MWRSVIPWITSKRWSIVNTRESFYIRSTCTMIYYVMKLYLISFFFYNTSWKKIMEDSIQSFSPLLRAISVKPWTSGMMSGCQWSRQTNIKLLFDINYNKSMVSLKWLLCVVLFYRQCYCEVISISISQSYEFKN